MNKSNAITYMNKGYKVTHQYFSKNEWMMFLNGKIQFEDGCRCDSKEFWAGRKGNEWDTGYSLWSKS